MNGQITYQVIIDYLSQSQSKENSIGDFPTKENIIVNSKDFNKKIRKFFNKNYFRYGVLSYDNEQNNISFFSSLLLCLDEQFLTFNKANRLQYITSFKNKLKNDYTNDKLYKKFGYKRFNIDSGVIFEEIANNVSIYVMQLVVDYLDINIIIFNFDDFKRYGIYAGEIMNTFRPTLLFGYGNGYFEPIFTNKKKYFCSNDKVMKKLIVNNIYKYGNNEKTLIGLNNDIYHMINDLMGSEDSNVPVAVVNQNNEINQFECTNSESIEEDSIDINDDEDSIDINDDEELIEDSYEQEYSDNDKTTTFVKKTPESEKWKGYSLSKFLRMRKDELLDIINSLQLNIGEYQTKTKKEIASSIVNKLSA
ncbi:hypothetical protein CPAV1605_907 [seawater metagenome]|uniref:Uncharacterized protein n=1 Tax=seawater metagenome TaxID=1561972 RepID=A0A5E8CM00_9ZZZZ